MHYFVRDHRGVLCTHQHRTIGGGLATCLNRARAVAPPDHVGPRVYQVDDAGTVTRVPTHTLASTPALRPRRPVGRPAGQTPRIEQGKRLSARLSVAERERYEKLAARAGMELGEFALYLLEREALAQAQQDQQPQPESQNPEAPSVANALKI